MEHCKKCKGLGVFITLEYNPNNPYGKCPECDGKRTIYINKDKLDFIDGKLQTWEQFKNNKQKEI